MEKVILGNQFIVEKDLMSITKEISLLMKLFKLRE